MVLNWELFVNYHDWITEIERSYLTLVSDSALQEDSPIVNLNIYVSPEQNTARHPGQQYTVDIKVSVFKMTIDLSPPTTWTNSRPFNHTSKDFEHKTCIIVIDIDSAKLLLCIIFVCRSGS